MLAIGRPDRLNIGNGGGGDPDPGAAFQILHPDVGVVAGAIDALSREEPAVG